MNIKEKIRNYIINDLSQSKVDIKDLDSLYDHNILDSLNIIQLVVFLQKEFQININPAHLLIEDFETIDSIVELVKKWSLERSK